LGFDESKNPQTSVSNDEASSQLRALLQMIK